MMEIKQLNDSLIVGRCPKPVGEQGDQHRQFTVGATHRPYKLPNDLQKAPKASLLSKDRYCPALRHHSHILSC